MSESCLELDAPPPGSSYGVKALLVENARLRRLCAEAKELASRHELALREGDHRIKNSLQIVASLMGMQERRETSETARAALHAATARVQAIARMHDALQLNGSSNKVNLGALVETMCLTLHAMAGDPIRVKVIVNVEPLEAPIAVAQPVVLAVNELVVNALRHAFPADRSGTVHVELKCVDGELRVVVADDGAGLPADHDKAGGYGMKLVRMMAAKIGAKLNIESPPGARFTLSAPYGASA
ncbi:sensor histidine kinase [Terricaulis silvestris]|uniref:histidine kinase n=1 Tax=Terricaulis silvestris TaxID=2686094 RepID=A0A6I6MMN9_9CAUL|nr:sensor histidine kinase [Terricaulis silvestris]QGZ94234.1 putative sensor histidine kinase pdtaS [Terricaulis silvestris]